MFSMPVPMAVPVPHDHLSSGTDRYGHGHGKKAAFQRQKGPRMPFYHSGTIAVWKCACPRLPSVQPRDMRRLLIWWVVSGEIVLSPLTTHQEAVTVRTVITGGAGFIGSHLCERFLERGHEVICVDNLITGELANIDH